MHDPTKSPNPQAPENNPRKGDNEVPKISPNGD